MGKTYRKDNPDTKRRKDTQPGKHGNKTINHDQERTRKRRILKDIEETWFEDEDLYSAE